MNSFLKEKAAHVWLGTVALHGRNPAVRIASSLSCVELLTVLYYGGYLRFKASEPRWSGRDRVIASKGHGAVALYPILADLNFFDSASADEIGNTKTVFGMIPDPNIPGIETVNGSLGHGLGVGAGMALALKRSCPEARVVVLNGDGELGEGSVWEAVRFAADKQLSNLIMLLDMNGKSMLGSFDCGASDFAAKFEAFGWRTVSCDGHDVRSIAEAYDAVFNAPGDRPCAIIAQTVKGHGIPELENSELCHVMSLKPERVAEILKGGSPCL